MWPGHTVLCLAQHSGHVHLRQANLLSDLSLRELTEKSQHQNCSLPRRQLGSNGRSTS